ncbi:hypothetical protein ACFVYC_16595 [Pseudarthrobacter sp. NPDC058329]|uniref:hypothetical protein n=1 Tax=Pseudarthrobacter sp. NPDC058329 TaxID=3346448 RepID=UPI0036DCB12A
MPTDTVEFSPRYPPIAAWGNVTSASGFVKAVACSIPAPTLSDVGPSERPPPEVVVPVSVLAAAAIDASRSTALPARFRDQMDKATAPVAVRARSTETLGRRTSVCLPVF